MKAIWNAVLFTAEAVYFVSIPALGLAFVCAFWGIR